MSHSSAFVDVSHTVEHGMVTYKGLPAPVVCDYWTREYSRRFYAPGTEFQIGKIEMVANTGTYLDSPFHRSEDGKDLSQLELTSLANLDVLLVRAKSKAARAKGKGERAIDVCAFHGFDVEGKAILIHTAWDVHWRTDQYFEDHPFLTKDATQFLAD